VSLPEAGTYVAEAAAVQCGLSFRLGHCYPYRSHPATPHGTDGPAPAL